MKAVLAFLMACQILGSSWLPGVGIDQSARVVDLVQHYHHHREAAPGLGFWEFLSMHYRADSEHQKHPNHSHQNLPTAGHVSPVFVPQTLQLPVSEALSLLLPTQKSCFGYANHYSFLGVFRLINPPQPLA